MANTLVRAANDVHLLVSNNTLDFGGNFGDTHDFSMRYSDIGGNDHFVMTQGSDEVFRVNKDRVVSFAILVAPTATAGGFYFDGTDFYLGA